MEPSLPHKIDVGLEHWTRFDAMVSDLQKARRLIAAARQIFVNHGGMNSAAYRWCLHAEEFLGEPEQHGTQEKRQSANIDSNGRPTSLGFRTFTDHGDGYSFGTFERSGAD